MFTNQNNNVNHSFFMNLALKQAKKSLGKTKENPSVGCILTKDNYVINAGCTAINGRPHAERIALNNSKFNYLDSHLYVTLEPCCHHGKTPPCVDLIIKKKIKKVFFSIFDPDLRSYKKSTNKLKKDMVTVKRGLLKKDINHFYRSYIKLKKNVFPFVTCKLAISKDFYTISKKDKWLTNEYSRNRVHLLRTEHDCIITSSRTVNKDNPQFTCRIDGLKKYSPSRIILDKNLAIKGNSKLIKESNKYRTIIFHNSLNFNKLSQLKMLNVKSYKIPTEKDGNLNLKEVLIKAKKLGFNRIFVEAGARLSKNFFKEKLVDDFILFMSNTNLKKNGNASIKDFFSLFLKGKKRKFEKVNLFDDKLFIYKVK